MKNADTNVQDDMLALAKQARHAAMQLATVPAAEKNHALQQIANMLRQSKASILAANQEDIALAKRDNRPAAFIDRLMLDEARIEAMAKGLEVIAALDDPVGKVLDQTIRPNGLEITRISVPIGVIGVIYESRPNVTADAAGLCLKAGNAVILRGGSESFHSAHAIMQAIKDGLALTRLPAFCVQMVSTTDRAAVYALLKLDQYIDVIVPRGGQRLIAHIAAESRIPLFKHLAGICHTYIHAAANLEMAKKVVCNAKMRRTGICGATETLLVDEAVIASHLPQLLDALFAAGCEIRGEQRVQQCDSRVHLASAADFDTEFLDAIIAVKIVPNLDAAIEHIALHGTQHTDAIITEDNEAAETFLKAVDSAIVMHNASTQFADGGEFGMGAEIGIATGKLHARGPIGVQQLTTFKYQVRGQGQIRT